MRKNPFNLVLIVSTLLVSGCNIFSTSSGNPENHEHTYIVKNAVEPTCEVKGNIKYLYCPICTCYFDVDRNPALKKDIFIDSLGHKFDHLVVSGNYQTKYFVGDQFDCSNLQIFKACGRDGCDKKEEITDYTVSYQSQLQTSFNENDSKIFINALGFSVQIDIIVNQKVNSIIGLEDSYSLYCHQKVDTSSIQATSGTLNFKYFSDKSLLNEVDSDSLIGNNVYYLKVFTTNEGIGFETVSKVAQVNVTHKYKDVSNIEKISYHSESCSYCKNVLTDIGKTENYVLDSLTKYGMNAQKLTNGENEGNPNSSNTPYWSTNNAESVVEMYFPKVNYHLFSLVTFNWKSSGTANNPISIGVNYADDLLPLKNHGLYPFGQIKVSLINNKVHVTVQCSDSYNKYVEFEDAEIAYGNKPLRLYFKSSNYRCFYLNSVSLTNYEIDPKTTMKVDGYDVPNYENGEAIEITAYLTPKLTSDNYQNVLGGLKDCHFSKVLPLLDGRGGSKSDEFFSAAINYVNSTGSAKINLLSNLYQKIDNLCSFIKESNEFNISKSHEYGIKYYAFNEGIYDLLGALNQSKVSISPDDYEMIIKRFYLNFSYASLDGCVGLTLSDEPNLDQLDLIEKGVKAYREANLLGEPFVNLLPTAKPSDDKYVSYINKYMSNVYPYLNYVSFDIYPLLSNGTIESSHLFCMNTIAQSIYKANTGGQLRTFIHSYNKKDESSHSATESENALLFQANSAIAFGSREIIYYSYSSNTDTEALTAALVNGKNYTKSNVYYYAQKANEKIKNIGQVIGSFNWKGVMKTGTCTSFNNVSPFLSNFESLQGVNSSYSPALIGCYSNGDNEGYFITNYSDPRTTTNSTTYTLNLDDSYSYALIYKDNTKYVKKIERRKIEIDLVTGNSAFVIPF